MTWRNDLRTRLLGDAGLAALVGERIAWFEAGRSWAEYPAIVLQEISPGREYTHAGPDGLDEPRVQFDIFAIGGVSAFEVEAALMAAMEQGAVEAGGTRFGFGFLEGRRMLDPADLGGGVRVQRLSLDFSFFHEAI